MRVVSLIRRHQGHVVDMDADQYAFMAPDWACEVTNPEHIARFRAIPEGYRLEESSAQMALTGLTGERPARRTRFAPGRSEPPAPGLLDGP